MKKIYLQNSDKVAVVDKRDYKRLDKFSWCLVDGYAKRTWYNPKLKQARKVTMSFDIMGFICDHKDLNKLNNTRKNLRRASQGKNMRNKRKQKNNTSGYKGVCWHPHAKKWMVVIQYKYKRHNLGYFLSSIKAAKVYDAAARRYHKKFARVNFPGKGERQA